MDSYSLQLAKILPLFGDYFKLYLSLEFNFRSHVTVPASSFVCRRPTALTDFWAGMQREPKMRVIPPSRNYKPLRFLNLSLNKTFTLEVCLESEKSIWPEMIIIFFVISFLSHRHGLEIVSCVYIVCSMSGYKYVIITTYVTGIPLSIKRNAAQKT